MRPAAVPQQERGIAARDLRWLLGGIVDAPAIDITGISTDSRSIGPGNVFLAVKGIANHGITFVDRAVEAGAVAILWDSATAPDPGARGAAAMIAVRGLADRLGELANRWFDAPSDRMSVSGITGTNGKTTVAFLVAQCMQLLRTPCAYMGTLGAGIATPERETGLTTPGCIELHRNLADFAERGVAHAALEVSSHALHQHRIDGIRFDSVLFTNLSRDHIDYHGDMDAYGETKARFIMDGDVANRIVMVDSPFGLRLANRCMDRSADNLIAVSSQSASDAAAMTHVHLQAIETDELGSTVAARSSWGNAQFHLPLAGSFNVANAALVLAQLLAWRIPLSDAANALSRALPPPGRMQRVLFDAAAPVPAVYIDYAHTPAGLEAVLTTIRSHCKGNLWCVFGCGGDRDRGKRGPMGRIVARLADRAIVTSDNPRSENPSDIIAEVLRHMPGGTVAIEDRAVAIAHAVSLAESDDVVLIAGKGHENYQVIGDTRRPFSDYDVALSNLEKREPGSRPQ